MGLYVNHRSDGSVMPVRKIVSLMDDGCEKITTPIEEYVRNTDPLPFILCVIRHPQWDAAGWVYDGDEFMRFLYSANHSKSEHIWMTAPPELIKKNFPTAYAEQGYDDILQALEDSVSDSE